MVRRALDLIQPVVPFREPGLLGMELASHLRAPAFAARILRLAQPPACLQALLEIPPLPGIRCLAGLTLGGLCALLELRLIQPDSVQFAPQIPPTAGPVRATCSCWSLSRSTAICMRGAICADCSSVSRSGCTSASSVSSVGAAEDWVCAGATESIHRKEITQVIASSVFPQDARMALDWQTRPRRSGLLPSHIYTLAV